MIEKFQDKFQGFHDIGEIKKSAISTLYKAVDDQTGKSVLLKLILLDHYTYHQRENIKEEISRLQTLKSELVLNVTGHLAVNLNGNAYSLLTLEDFPGSPLIKVLHATRACFPKRIDRNQRFCSMAIKMAEAVREIHNLGLVHRGLNPYGFYIDINNCRLKLDGFAWEHAWCMECRNVIDRNTRINILPYIAPEQTGRMNHSIDFRANLYSLGVLFYKILTGRTPFPANDSLEIIYGHMAGQLTPPRDLVPAIHPSISRIIMKLLAKNPDDRYQSIAGLIHDLTRIKSGIRLKQDVSEFVPGQKDVSPFFKIPDKLYGRDKEITFLKNCYHRVRGGDICVVLLAGEPGVGKTALSRLLSTYVHQNGGIFLTGKYHRHMHKAPLSVHKTLISGFVKRLLTQSPESIEDWRKKIISAISPNGQILIDMIPEMELIIGKQSPVCKLPPMESRIRINLVIDKAASLIINKDHPLVIFLDDLQWADRESLEQGMSFLLVKQRQYLMVLGSYRSNEVDRTSPAFNFLNKLRRTSIPCEILHLEPFRQLPTSQMVSGILGNPDQKSHPLAKVVYAKTGGNPLYIRQFMNSLHSNGLLRYDVFQGCWAYDIDRVAAETITENVATMLLNDIKKMPPNTLEVLQAAACIGNRPDVDLLCEIVHRDRPYIIKHIQVALEMGFVRALNEVAHKGVIEDCRPESDDYFIEFAHDQILQAIYQSIPRAKTQRLHRRIGRVMLQRKPADKKNKEIFDIVHHFKRAIRQVVLPEETIELAQLNLIAGETAMDSASFESALAYLRFGSHLLPASSWETHYDLSAAIYSRLSKCEFVLGNFDTAEKLFGILLEKATYLLEKVRVYNSMVVLNTATGNIDKALELGRQGLNLLHIKLPQAPGKIRLLYALIKLRILWGFRKVSSIIDAPENKEEALYVTLTLMTNIGLPAFFVNPSLCLWIISKASILGIKDPKKGFPLEHASFGLITLGAFLGSMFGFIRMGRMYTKIGMLLLKEYPYGPYQAIAYFVSAFFNRHWYEPARKNIEYLKRAYRHAIKMGEISYAGLSINAMSTTRLFLGDPLDDIYAYHKRHETFIKNTRSPVAIAAYKALTQFYMSLTGQTDSPVSLNSTNFDEEGQYEEAANMGNGVLSFIILLLRLKLLVLYHEDERALTIIEKLNPIAHVPAGTLLLTEYYFYAFLAAASLVRHNTSKACTRQCKGIMRVCLRKTRRWCRLCPDNFKHMLLMMEAEKERISGHWKNALQGYRRTIEISKARGFTHITAMACESTGDLLLSLKDPIAARSYLNEAKIAFSTWGARAKAKSIQQRYGDLLIPLAENNTDTDHGTPMDHFDFKSIVNALQAISKEIVVRNLLTKLTRIILENTGAHRAVFISNKNDDLFVEVESLGGIGGETQVMTSPVLDYKDRLLSSVAYYVKRTRELIVIDDVQNGTSFITKAGTGSAAPKSLLCMPMIRSNTLVGILYLENKMTSGVFTDKRIETLKMIASQAAISFENATLYEHIIKNEQELKSLSQNLRSLYSELMLTEERERRRIATELHDRIGHALASAKMHLEDISDTLPSNHRRRIADILAMIEQSIADTRTLTFELSPPILYHLGLGAAADWLCEETQSKHGLSVTFTDTSQGVEIDQKKSILCFQILRELMFNVIKHAHAKRIDVTLHSVREYVQLTVKDDGIGFEFSRKRLNEKKNHGGFGLFSINERLNLIGGRMRINSIPNQVTSISIVIPCKESPPIQKRKEDKPQAVMA